MAAVLAIAAPATGGAEAHEPDPRADGFVVPTHDGLVRPSTAPEMMRAQAQSDAECGTITTDTVLTEERAACWNGWIVGDDVTVDLNGLTLHDTGLLVDGDRITVRNGTLELEGVSHSGIYVLGRDVTIERMTLQNSPTNFVVEAAHGTTVRHSVFRNNASIAVDQYFGGEVTVEGNHFIGNGAGVAVLWAEGARISGNRFEDNAIGVNISDAEFHGANGTVVSYNSFDRNGIGVRVTGMGVGATGTVIERNHFSRSEASAIAITSNDLDVPYGERNGAAGTTVRHNVIHHSGSEPLELTVWCGNEAESCGSATADDGITVLSAHPSIPPTITVAGNVATRNAGHGIEAPGVRDGYGNVAAANGATPNCVGVSCLGPDRRGRR